MTNLLRDESWREAHAEKAKALYANQGLHRQAEFVAQLHPHAIQYLELAPILVLAAAYGGQALRRSERLYIAQRFGPLCERGERLKVVMEKFGMAYPLRRIKASSFGPKSWPAIRLLAEIPPSPLALSIPDKGQRKWLSALTRWTSLMAYRSKPAGLMFDWAARELNRNPDAGDVLPMVDFICSNEAGFNPAWGWRRASQECDLWHDRLASGAALREMKIPADFEIDQSGLPATLEGCGFTLELLRTPRALFLEGRAMRHCVASYVRDVIDGRSNIYSIRQEGARVATLELHKGKIVQIKAHCNRRPSAAVRAAADFFVELIKAEAA